MAGPGTLSVGVPTLSFAQLSVADEGSGGVRQWEAENNSALGSNGEADFQTRFEFTTNVEKNALFH